MPTKWQHYVRCKTTLINHSYRKGKCFDRQRGITLTQLRVNLLSIFTCQSGGSVKDVSYFVGDARGRRYLPVILLEQDFFFLYEGGKQISYSLQIRVTVVFERDAVDYSFDLI